MSNNRKIVNKKLGFLLLVGILMLSLLPLYGSGDKSKSEVHWLSDLSVVNRASAKLERTDSDVSYKLKTSGLTSGDAVTNWYVIFNYPSACSNPTPSIGALCNFPDLFNPDVGASLLFADGLVIKDGDHVKFRGHLSIGDTTGILFGPGLLNPLGAEIHIIVRTHGPVINELMPGMIQTIDVGCDINVCEDLQATAFSPIPLDNDDDSDDDDD